MLPPDSILQARRSRNRTALGMNLEIRFSDAEQMRSALSSSPHFPIESPMARVYPKAIAKAISRSFGVASVIDSLMPENPPMSESEKRMRDAMKQILSVSKPEILRREAEAKKQRQEKREK